MSVLFDPVFIYFLKVWLIMIIIFAGSCKLFEIGLEIWETKTGKKLEDIFRTWEKPND